MLIKIYIVKPHHLKPLLTTEKNNFRSVWEIYNHAFPPKACECETPSLTSNARRQIKPFNVK